MWTGFQECQVSKEFRVVLNWFYDEENLHLRPTEISFGKLNLANLTHYENLTLSLLKSQCRSWFRLELLKIVNYLSHLHIT